MRRYAVCARHTPWLLSFDKGQRRPELACGIPVLGGPIQGSRAPRIVGLSQLLVGRHAHLLIGATLATSAAGKRVRAWASLFRAAARRSMLSVSANATR